MNLIFEGEHDGDGGDDDDDDIWQIREALPSWRGA
jgi:hypothetical protein